MDSSVADYIKYLGFQLFLTHSVNSEKFHDFRQSVELMNSFHVWSDF